MNDCHAPAGSAKGGQFCSDPDTEIEVKDKGHHGVTVHLGPDGVNGEITFDKTDSGMLQVSIATIKSAYRGKGHAQRMYLAAADWAKKHGYLGVVSSHDRTKDADRAWNALKRKTTRVSTRPGRSPYNMPGARHMYDVLERSLLEFNPYHEPAGSSKGGRFARKGSGEKSWVATAKAEPLHGTNRWEQEYGSLFKSVEARVNKVLATEGDTKSRYTRPDGSYTPARLAEHVQIAERYLAKFPNRPSQAQPLAIITGGLPGSGKTTAVLGDVNKADKVYINSDDIKELMPGYEGWNAAVYHRESEDLSQLVLHMATERRQNLIFDYTMKSTESAKTRVRDLERAGYRVEGRFVDVPVERSVDGALGRFVRGLQNPKRIARYVHPAYIRGHEIRSGTHSTTRSRRAFDAIKHRLAAFKIVSTNVQKGDAPVLLEQRGKLTS